MKEINPHSGVIVPMATPFTAEGELDDAGARNVIDHMINGGVGGVFVLGTTGENASMTPAMRTQLVKTTVEHTGDRAAVYAGIGSNCVSETIEAANEFLSMGVKAVVAHLPSYYPLTPEQMASYFTHIADKINGDLLLYNIPPTTHMSIPIDVVEKVSSHPRIVGLKDSENNAERLEKVLERFKDMSGFSILAGCAALSCKAMAGGGDGLVPSSGNIAPRFCQDLYEHALQGDFDAAEKDQDLMDKSGKIYQKDRTLGQSLAGIKIALNLLGLCGPHMLPPLLELGEADRQQVSDDMNALGLI